MLKMYIMYNFSLSHNFASLLNIRTCSVNKNHATLGRARHSCVIKAFRREELPLSEYVLVNYLRVYFFF